jgi:hypothetical protein
VGGRPEPDPLAGVSEDRRNQATAEFLLAEYHFLSGLIPFYRQVEMTALAGTGLVLSGVVAALAALEAADRPNRAAEGVLLAVGAWAPTLLLLVENVALTRLRRASLYIAEDLHPLAVALTGRQVLSWELAPGRRLMETFDAAGEARRGWAGRIATRRSVQFFASSAPLLMTMMAASVVFAVAGVVLHATLLNAVVGGLAALCALAIGAYGIAFTWIQEQRHGAAEARAPRGPGAPTGRGV